jgi:hypothetical protein
LEKLDTVLISHHRSSDELFFSSSVGTLPPALIILRSSPLLPRKERFVFPDFVYHPSFSEGLKLPLSFLLFFLFYIFPFEKIMGS